MTHLTRRGALAAGLGFVALNFAALCIKRTNKSESFAPLFC